MTPWWLVTCESIVPILLQCQKAQLEAETNIYGLALQHFFPLIDVKHLKLCKKGGVI